jgi:putative hydrolase of the HAD superfamily
LCYASAFHVLAAQSGAPVKPERTFAMTKRPIGAITFDLWDCLFCDDTDEAKRKAAGLPPKPAARRDLLHAYLSRQAPIDRAMTDLAFDVTDAAFNRVWREDCITWPVADRMRVLLTGLKRDIPAPDFSEFVTKLENMELEYRPEPAPGAVEALKALHGKYRLAVISDAVFSPGKNLRVLLKDAGMIDYFDHFVFSDEAGHSKPHPSVFQSVADAFTIGMEDIVHIGDRPHNDIGGAHAVGARGLLLRVVKQRDLEGHTPDAVCDDYTELPAVLASMES